MAQTKMSPSQDHNVGNGSNNTVDHYKFTQESQLDQGRHPTSPHAKLKPSTTPQWDGLESVLLKHFLFAGTEASKIQRVAQRMFLLNPQPGETIVQEGDIGDSMYIVECGELHVTNSSSGPNTIDTLGSGRVFGELAVLYDSPRAATVTAHQSGTRIWCLTRSVLRELEGTFMAEKLEKRAKILSGIPEFEKFEEAKLRRLASTMQEEVFDAGTSICSEGECLITGVNDRFYVIADGCVDVYVTVAATAPVSVNDDLIAPGEIEVPVPQDDLDALYKLAARVSEKISSTPLSSARLSEIVPSGDLEESDDEESSSDDDSEVTSAGTSRNLPLPPPLPGPTQEKVATLGKGQWFGEMALISNEPRSATVFALERTVCFTLTRSAFVQIVSGSKSVYSRITSKSELRKQDNHEAMFRNERNDLASRLYGLPALKVQHVIGEGAFSVVRLATIKGSDSIAFALKTMNKQDLAERNQIMHVKNERAILEKSSHPFILSLIRTFQTPNHIYMLLELVQGGELFSQVVDSKGGLSPRSVKFYAACILEGLSYLHRKHIAYRDLKLENLIISSEGYVKIIDFGFAKQLGPGTFTNTLCGTPDYLAPEAVMRKGHDQAVDCWALGVLMFEMLTQFSPFADPSGQGNQMTVFKRIINGPRSVDWRLLQRAFANETPEQLTHVRAMFLRLWDANPNTRIQLIHLKEGNEPAKAFFEDIDFTRLRLLEITPPWTPQIKSASDTSYFDVEAFTNSRECHKLFQPTSDEMGHAFDVF